MLLLSLIPSGIGFVLFVYGKKQDRWAHVGAGLALMVYPYFVATVVQMLLGARSSAVRSGGRSKPVGRPGPSDEREVVATGKAS